MQLLSFFLRLLRVFWAKESLTDACTVHQSQTDIAQHESCECICMRCSIYFISPLYLNPPHCFPASMPKKAAAESARQKSSAFLGPGHSRHPSVSQQNYASTQQTDDDAGQRNHKAIYPHVVRCMITRSLLLIVSPKRVGIHGYATDTDKGNATRTTRPPFAPLWMGVHPHMSWTWLLPLLLLLIWRTKRQKQHSRVTQRRRTRRRFYAPVSQWWLVSEYAAPSYSNSMQCRGRFEEDDNASK